MVTFIFASFSCFVLFFGYGENVENFRFDIFLAITQEPQDIWKFWLNIWILLLSLHKIGIFLWENILQFISETNKLVKYGSTYITYP